MKTSNRAFSRKPWLLSFIFIFIFIFMLSIGPGVRPSYARSGPVFYDGEDFNIIKYTKKKKISREELMEEEPEERLKDLTWLTTVSDENAVPPTMTNPPLLTLTIEEKAILGFPPAEGDVSFSTLTEAQKNVEFEILDTNASFNGKSRSGKYIYAGDVPRFSAGNIELYVSKVGLTLRVKAWVDQALKDNYRYTLINRWWKLYRDFQDPVLSFVPLKDPIKFIDSLEADPTRRAYVPWMKVAAQYMHHSFQDFGISPFIDEGTTPDTLEYKNTIFTAMLRKMMGGLDLNGDRKDLEIEDGLEIYQKLSAEYADSLATKTPIADAEISNRLFDQALGENYTTDTSHTLDGVQSLGYLTFVYPISANFKGPFKDPKPFVHRFGGVGSSYSGSRAMSKYWVDEYGGFPFMEVVDGVGLHGPITSKDALKVWFLQRGYVSHGCFRMDAGDVEELRALLPMKIPSKKTVPLRITEWPDTTAFGEGAPLEVMDTAYYYIPSKTSVSTPYLLKKAQQAFWKMHYSPVIKWRTAKGKDMTLSKPFYEAETGKPYTDPVTGNNLALGFDPVNKLVLNVPTFDDDGVEITGILPSAKIHTFKSRPTSIIQYREEGTTYGDLEYQATSGDSWGGKYDPERELRY